MKTIASQLLSRVTGGGLKGLIATCVATGATIAVPTAIHWWRESRAK